MTFLPYFLLFNWILLIYFDKKGGENGGWHRLCINFNIISYKIKL